MRNPTAMLALVVSHAVAACTNDLGGLDLRDGAVPDAVTFKLALCPIEATAGCGCTVMPSGSNTVNVASLLVTAPSALETTTPKRR